MSFVRWRRGGRNGDEAIGGFIESILAVMAVITASSVFLVILSAGAVQEREAGADMEEMLHGLRENGLLDDEDALDPNTLGAKFDNMILPEGVHGIGLRYRMMGDASVLLSLGSEAPDDVTVLAERVPLLLEIDGRATPAMLEVDVW